MYAVQRIQIALISYILAQTETAFIIDVQIHAIWNNNNQKRMYFNADRNCRKWFIIRKIM